MPETIVRLSDCDRAMIAAAAAEIAGVLMSMHLAPLSEEDGAFIVKHTEKIRSRVLAAGDATPTSEDRVHA